VYVEAGDYRHRPGKGTFVNHDGTKEVSHKVALAQRGRPRWDVELARQPVALKVGEVLLAEIFEFLQGDKLCPPNLIRVAIPTKL